MNLYKGNEIMIILQEVACKITMILDISIFG